MTKEITHKPDCNYFNEVVKTGYVCTCGAELPPSNELSASITISRATANLIRSAFLPDNPRKMRTAHPDVRRAAEEFIAALAQPTHEPPACPSCGGTGGHWEGCKAPEDRASPSPCPVTEADEAGAFDRWFEQQRRENFVLAHGHDEKFRDTWGQGYRRPMRDGWMARAKLSTSPPPAECAGCEEFVRMQHDIASLLGVDSDTDSIGLHELIYGELTRRAAQPPCPECEKRKHANDRVNYETTEDGFRICRGYHHRSADCEWEYYVRRPSQPPPAVPQMPIMWLCQCGDFHHERLTTCPKVFPIARLTIAEDDTVTATMYAPGLPPGEHDVYPVGSPQPPPAVPLETLQDIAFEHRSSKKFHNGVLALRAALGSRPTKGADAK